MSGFNAHYFFGNNHLQLLEDSDIKNICKKYSNVFSIGLQGPDIFFYFVIAGFSEGKNLGSLVHVEETDRFFQNMYRGLSMFQNRPVEKAIAIAYMSGFLGHYILDVHTHPYIYGRTKYTENPDAAYYDRHVFLESDIDRLILERYSGLKPSEFYQERTILLSKSECRVITDLLYYTFKKTYASVRTLRAFIQSSLYTMPLGCYVLHDKHGRKKAWLRKLEDIFLGYPLASTLVPSDTLLFFRDPLNLSHKKWSNPWDQTTISCESYMDLYENAGAEYLDILREFNGLLANDRLTMSDSFLNRLGNRSYHSGLDCNIPS